MFEVLRSTNGIDFIKISEIKSNVNINTNTNYSYLDNNVSQILGNNIFYKLKQIDIDGKITFSPIIKFILGSKSRIEVFPNPFNNNFTIAFSAIKTSKAMLKLQNSAGVLVFNQSINIVKGSNSIFITSLPTLNSGIYYATINSADLSFKIKLQKL
jgi:hypothetical protein